MKHIFLNILILLSFTLKAQYPSTSTLLADVKKQNSAEFVTITPVGSWNMFHDKVPDWQQPDACRHEVNIVGKKNNDGSYWTYNGLVIYSKVGSSFVFNRIFFNEDATSLNGLKIPDNEYFKKIFMSKLESKDDMLMTMNFELKNAKAFYGFEMKNTPKISGNGNDLFALFVVEVTLDLLNGSRLEKKIVPIQIKANKSGSDFIFQHAMKKNDGKLIDSKDLGSSDAGENLESYGFSSNSLNSFIKTNNSYAISEGDNGNELPNDKDIIENMDNTFLKSADNFAILFGPRGASMMTAVKFIKKEVKAIDVNNFKCTFTVQYVFNNENSKEMTFKVITAERDLETSFVKENGKWYADQSIYLNEPKYVKNESIAWTSRLNYQSKTFENTVFKK
jgi:hypothetical protein